MPDPDDTRPQMGATFSMDSAGVFRAPGYPPPRRPGRGGRVLIAVLAAVMLASGTAGVLFYLQRDEPGKSGQPATTQASPEPKTVDAAKATAQKAMTRAFANDAAGAYDLLSVRGKSLISQADYVKFANTCGGLAGFGVEVTDIRLETPDKAVAIVQWMSFALTIFVVYEHQAWAWEPSAEYAADWPKPVDQRIAEGRANGSCVAAG